MQFPLTALRLFIVLALAFAATACTDSDDNGDESSPAYDQGPFLTNLADNLIVPGYETFATETAELRLAAEAFVQNPDANILSTLQTELKAAWLAWEAVSCYAFGPAMEERLQMTLQTFPTDTARILSNIQEGQWNLGSAQNSAAIGFPALDYLLHARATDSIVYRFSTSPQAGQWQQYLTDLVQDIDTRAQAVRDSWTGGYRTTFVENTGNDQGSSLGLLINELVRDWELLRRNKIGDCIGVRFLNEINPRLVEAYYAGYSKELALAHGTAMRNFFLGIGTDGTNGPGLDDYLNAVEASASTGEPLATAISDQMQLALTKTEEIPGRLQEAATNATEDVRAAYDEYQRAIPLLKTDMTSALGVLITFNSGDGD